MATSAMSSKLTAPDESQLAGYHRWTDLLFLHWRVPASEIRPLIPAGLTLETFDNAAWIGVVPFQLFGVCPKWFFPVPGVSDFREVNVRTYVHVDGHPPGVWFFSLDASRSLAVRIARWKWNLPYYRAAMSLKRSGSTIEYASERLWPGAVGPGMDIAAEVGDYLSVLDKDHRAGEATEGTLEYFLAERYLFYSVDRGGRIFKGRVHHQPYRLREAKVTKLQESLAQASNISLTGDPQHVLFCDDVDVKVYNPQPVSRAIAG